jgi:asparagine synthase (glutamine-hydrolysing)
MCGIAGFVGDPDPATLRRMVRTLVHRGPDGEGFWESPQASLGMRRLAIIDIETGGQPVFSEDEQVVVVFNGEIYNHVELRRQLETQGHRFRTHHSDSEVIVHLYEQHGDDFPNRLRGMFAIALWDRQRRRLVLVRDRAGIKPLYYAERGGSLLFGSELKALLAHPAVSRTPDLVALHHFFTFKNVPAPRSAFAEVRQLRPGERLVHEDSETRCERWWQMRFAENEELDETEAAEQLRALLTESVKEHLQSDTPYGAYLSGGLDSSSVVAIMAGLTGAPVRTFTLTYNEDFPGKIADRDFARRIARQYGCEHREREIGWPDVERALDRVISSFDEPFSGVISTDLLTELIGQHVKVCLSGDGADELFGSYKPHRLAQPLAAWRAIRQGRSASNLPPDPSGEFSTEELDALCRRGDEADIRIQQYLADDAVKSTLYAPEMREIAATDGSVGLVRRTLSETTSRDPLNRMLFLDFETLLPDQVLAFVDRLSMAHSVEVRPPFLDHRIIEFAATLPGRMKIRDGRIKHILKRAVAPLLPADLIDRPKEGFLMPINRWLLAELRGPVESALSPARVARSGVLDPQAVSAMLAAHFSGEGRSGDRIWTLYMFQLWWERMIEGRAG